ncbi:MAG: serine/threonine-protein kinase [Acidobacteria bacterium]|nr:serine/threonine-protein kinase [Acidobacteriota bacterium]MCA1639696.1 serine/threonine-protein kinase [Acidobacteriota bacterium]
MRFAPHTRLGHFEIRKLLGVGGMGEVYLAEDTRLERKVALKILPETLAENEERMRRFVREAKAASALNHPNILTIYEIGEVAKTNFIAAEYVEGETLYKRLKDQLPELSFILEVAIQVASALNAAHAAGIVHRDIKPENVMIRSDNLAKLLDFGIAKLVEKQHETNSEAATAIKAETSPGTIIGTAAYMSPEQARGKTVDARTDIFSFGVMLYEMLSGKPPFEGENALDIIGSILHREPAPLDETEIPKELRRIVEKCLRKDREERYQTARDLLIDLKHIKQELEFQNKLERTASPNREEAKTQIISATTIAAPHMASSAEYIASEIKQHKRSFVIGLIVLLLASIGLGYWYFTARSTKQIDSIAVLPFVNESGNADNEYLSDGMTESLIGSLSQLPNLNVKARTSVFRYKGKEIDPKRIGQELSVQAILTGRIVQRGQDLTLYIELIDAATENVLWKDNYARSMSNLVSLQSDIAKDVSDKLKTKLSGAVEEQVTKTYTENAEAYQLYLKGLYHWNKRTSDDLKLASRCFSKL